MQDLQCQLTGGVATLTPDRPSAREADQLAMCFQTPYQAEAVRRFLGKEAAKFAWPQRPVVGGG